MLSGPHWSLDCSARLLRSEVNNSRTTHQDLQPSFQKNLVESARQDISRVLAVPGGVAVRTAQGRARYRSDEADMSV